jgi:hypothetical protein
MEFLLLAAQPRGSFASETSSEVKDEDVYRAPSSVLGNTGTVPCLSPAVYTKRPPIVTQ